MGGGKKKGDKGKKKAGKKSGGARANAVLDGVLMTSMTREQLEGHVGRLKIEVDREREERAYIQLEQERLQRLWEVATGSLNHERSVARLKDAEMAAAEESHHQQMKVLQHRIKNIMGQHEDSLTHVQVTSQETVSAVQESCLEQEGRLQEQLQHLTDKMATAETNYLSAIASLKVEHSRSLQHERENLLQEAQALNKKQDDRLVDVIDQLELKRKTQLESQETRKKQFLEEVMSSHQETVLEIKKYYTDITDANLKEITQLKNSVEERSSREGQVQRRISGLEQERDRLLQEDGALRQQVAGAARAIHRAKHLEQSLKTSSSRIRSLTGEKQQLQLRLEEVTQLGEKVSGERDALYCQLSGVVKEVRHRSEARNLVLEKKLNQLGAELEKREAVLSEVLAATNMDPEAVARVTRQLESIIEEKNNSIADLRTEVASMRRLYADLLNKNNKIAADKRH